MRLLRSGTVDAELAALLWLLFEGGVPLVVAGADDAVARADLAARMLSLHPGHEWVVLDADATPLRSDRLVALLRGGVGVGVAVAAADLAAVLQRLIAAGLPEDGARRLGVIAVARVTDKGTRLSSVHYLRPTERDGQGHVQRRPPAVLAAWDEAADAYEHYAWGITPELADRVARSQAEFELRQRQRTAFLTDAASDAAGMAEGTARIQRYLESEPPREPMAPSGC